jgi:hypothetical protein
MRQEAGMAMAKMASKRRRFPGPMPLARTLSYGRI